MERFDPLDPRRQREVVGAAVRSFYEALPFNYHAGAQSSVQAVLANQVAAVYPDLHALLASGRVRRALELGCGAGWLANTLAKHYGVEVVAIDFTAPALGRAREVATLLGIGPRVHFVESDLFAFQSEERFDLVLSMGVLHHTGDARGGVLHAASFVAPGGQLSLGLYHAPGRRVFLEALQGVAAREGEEAAFQRYRALDRARGGDETLLRSWFRDQVLHPHETQHSLRELVEWLLPCGFELLSTSINRFEPIRDLEAVLALEPAYAERSRHALEVERRYFPGFFTALLRRAPGRGTGEPA